MTAPMERKLEAVAHALKTHTNALNQHTKSVDRLTDNVRKLNMTLLKLEEKSANIPPVPELPSDGGDTGSATSG